MGLTLAKALRLSPSACVAFAGSGGKTTAIFQVAREMNGNKDQTVIVTTTTHFGVWQVPLADRHIVADSLPALENITHNQNEVILVTGSVEKDKTNPLPAIILNRLHEYCLGYTIPLLIEADGSRQKPIKAPGEHEPPIPDFVQQVIYVVGLAGLGKPLTEEYVHRPEIFSQLSGLKSGETITLKALTVILNHPEGGLKNITPQARRVILLNQADTHELAALAHDMSHSLLTSYHSVVIASLKPPPEIENSKSVIHLVNEPIAGILLAAGESKRFGQPKQLLNWRNQPFVRAVSLIALEAGLSPVVVVTGAYAQQVEDVLINLPVKIVHNQDWRSGLSSSVRAGLSNLLQPPTGNGTPTHPFHPAGLIDMGKVGAAIFLLADQPQIPALLIRSLVDMHSKGLQPVVAPMVASERRANPVLFDQVTFPDLMTLEGDVGGRAIFGKYEVEYLPWHDDKLLLDVDEPADYDRLLTDDIE
jgi:molybdenum cofactor cytidylyltransferase